MKAKFYISLIVIIVSACAKEKIIEKEVIVNPPEKSWQKHEAFQFGNEEVINAATSKDHLFLYGHENFSSIDRNGEINHANKNAAHSRNRLPLNSEIFLTTTNIEGGILVNLNLLPVESSAPAFIKIKDLDTNFTGFDFNRLNTGDAALISDNNKILVPYQTKNPENDISQLGLLLIKARIANNEIVDTLYTHRFIFQNQFGVFLQSLSAIDNIFFVNTTDGTYRMGDDNILTKVSDNIFSKIFKYKNQLYAINGNQLYFSENLGVSWSLKFNLSENLDAFLFKVIDDNLYAFYNSQIFNVEIFENEFFVQELVNDGLEGSLITSLAKFNDKIFVTSLSGVFTKSTSEFNTFKEPSGQ